MGLADHVLSLGHHLNLHHTDGGKPLERLNIKGQGCVLRVPPRGTRLETYKDKLVLSAVSWTVFIFTWLIFAEILHKIEHVHELGSLTSFHDSWEGLLSDFPADDEFATDLIELLEWLGEHGDCIVKKRDQIHWSFAGSAFYLLSIATTIGYGNFCPVTKGGRALTVVYSFLALPLFMCCLYTLVSVMEDGVRKYLPGYPRGEDTKSRVLSMKVDAAFFFLVTVLWMAIGGAVLIPGISRYADWGLGEGLYFSYITVSTIGLGDFTYTIEGTGGWGVFFVVGGLALFSAFLDAFTRLMAAFIAWLRWEAKKIFKKDFDPAVDLAEYTDDELLVANTAFTVINRDKNDVIDASELRQMLYLVGMDVDLDVEYRINETMYVYDSTLKQGIDAHTFFRMMKPVLSFEGRKSNIKLQMRNCLVSWLGVLVMLIVGGAVFIELEHEHELNSLDHWDLLLKKHDSHLSLAQEYDLTNMVEHLTHNGICSIPTCTKYSTDEANLYECESYESNWGSLRSTIFFCFTLITTIGYGNFTPSTRGGRFFAVAYSFLGMILMSYAIGHLIALPKNIESLYVKREDYLKREENRASEKVNEFHHYHRHRKGRENDEGNDKVVSATRTAALVRKEIELANALETPSEGVCDNHTSHPVIGELEELNAAHKAGSISDDDFIAAKTIALVKFASHNPIDTATSDDNPEAASDGALAEEKAVKKSGLEMDEEHQSKAPQRPKRGWLERFYDKKAAEVCIATILFITIAAAIYRDATNTAWSYGDAWYFMWISFSTIGLGDLTPHSGGYDEAIVITVIGLALVSYTLGLADDALSSFARRTFIEEAKHMPPTEERLPVALAASKEEDPDVIGRILSLFGGHRMPYMPGKGQGTTKGTEVESTTPKVESGWSSLADISVGETAGA